MKNLRVFDKLILVLILVNVIAAILESVQSINIIYHKYFSLFLNGSFLIFTLELFFRVFLQLNHQTGKNLRALASPVLIIDGIIVLLFYLPFNSVIDLRLLRLFRALSILQVLQNSRALHILQTILMREKRTLLSALFMMIVLVILEAAVIFALEREAQPEVFSSIPQAIWWTITTLTTVGFGDAVPITPLGKFFGILVMFIGILMFAIPTGILVSAFYQEIKRKDFIATWDLVAQVPFFSNLTATEIARIADLLSLHIVKAGEVIFHKGEAPDCMYFVVDGLVEIKKPGKTTYVKGGNFFGEIGVLNKTARNADVKAIAYTELLMLNSNDIELFLEFHPKLRERIFTASEKRRK